MNIRSSIYIVTLVLLFSSCKTAFEKVRTSGDPQKQLEAADQYYEKEDYLKAQTLYELAISSFRGRSESTELFYKYAYTHYYLKNYILSAYYFESYADKFPTSPYREDAMYMTAYSNFKLSPDYKLDQTYSQASIEAFQLFANTYPNSDKIGEINNLIDEMRVKLQKKSVSNGELYYDMGSYQAAVRTFEHTLQDFPETPRAEELRYKIIDAQAQLAINSIYEKKTDRARKTLDFIKVFRTKYPNSRYTNDVTRVEKKINELLNKLNDGRHKVTGTRSQS